MFEWKSWPGLALAVVIGLVAAAVVVAVVALIAGRAARRRDWAKALVSTARHPFRLLVVVVAVWIGVAVSWPDATTLSLVSHVLLIVAICAVTWLIAALVAFGLSAAVSRYRTDAADNRVARRARTQILIVRRLAIVVIVLIGLASALLTFPGIQAVGASIFASAGVVSIIAGLAAQSTLGNVFAGVQLAFSDAIRVDDVVVVNGEWGRIEEITLTYVVVHIWDDRRLVVPSTYFTGNPFENWTRNTSQLLGEVDFDLDWQVNPGAMRDELDRVLARAGGWDGRTSVLQVTDAVGGYVHVRVLVSAVDSPTLFDLRCFVREAMVEWIQSQGAVNMPRTRVIVGEEPTRSRSAATQRSDASVGLFTGTIDAQKRASEFTAPVQTQDPSVAPETSSSAGD